MRLCFLLFSTPFSCISFQETAISSSEAISNRCEGTAQDLINIANALPKGTSIRLPITITKVDPLVGVHAALGSYPISLVDMTSMGISGFANVLEGKTVWMDGQWGAMIELPNARTNSNVFGVSSVGETVGADASLTMMRLDGELNCAKP